MDILPSCVRCGNPFTSRRNRQKYCPVCIEQSHLCVDCGAIKHRSVRGPRCRKCTNILLIGKPNLKNRREEKPIEQIISEAESIGLLPEKQYAFGYVIGVVFGDGSVSKDVHGNLKRADGTVRPRPVTLYRVRLQVTEQVFAERFANQWTILTGKTPSIMTTTRTDFSKSTLKGRREEYRVNLFNIGPRHAIFGRYLAHLKYESDPSELLRFPLEAMRGFVYGMIDSEGYLNPKRPERIDIANKDIKLLDTLVLMLNCLEFGGKVYTNPSQTVSHLVTSMPYVKYGL